MRRIIAVDCQEYPYPPDMIFQVLSDLPGYANWWPKGVKVKVLEHSPSAIDSQVEVRASGGRFRCKILSLDAPYRIDIRYYDGVVKGDSYWSIEPLNNGLTRVCYAIDLEPWGFLPRMLSKVINFSWVHSWQMKRVLHGLGKYLSSMERNK